MNKSVYCFLLKDHAGYLKGQRILVLPSTFVEWEKNGLVAIDANSQHEIVSQKKNK